MEETFFSTFCRHLDSKQIDYFEKFYKSKRVVVTGGASFIGSNLVDLLISFGANVAIIDNFSSGKKANIREHSHLEIFEGDLRDWTLAKESLQGAEVVFHLAAVHGGRGFIETYKRDMLANFAIDNNVFSAAISNNVLSIVHASSACAYPIDLQESETELNLLSEHFGSMKKSETCFADGVYGWTKLIGEYQLENHVLGTGTKGRSARIFTAYGDRENESHAAIALIAKALLKADPYPIWGSGQQTRNFTYVSDTVTGLLFLGSDSRDIAFDVFNIGTSNHVKVIDFVNQIFSEVNWSPQKLDLQLDKPVGVASRASENTKIREVFGWEPTIAISEGIARTISWYRDSGLLPKSLVDLEERLMAR
jgi:nucleoside-diphosphate-sugar epimerase